MNTTKTKPQDEAAKSTWTYANSNFDFEAWAKAVRPQLVAALQKK